METELAVDNFIKLVRSSQSKQDFLSRAKEFDQRFVDSYPAPTIANNYPPSIPKSTTNSQKEISKPVEPIKNPFVNSQQEKYRHSAANIYKSGYPNKQNMRNQPVHSRSQQNFYKEDNSYMKDYFEQMNMNNFQGYPEQMGMYRQNQPNFQSGISYAQNMADPSFTQSKTGPNFYPQQANPAQNQYLANFQQQPQYVQYYKKMIPPHAPTQKIYTPTQRTNPFKNN